MTPQEIGETKKSGRITLFHLLVIGLSLLMTLGAWQFSKYQIEKRTLTRFEVSRDQTIGLITERMRKYEDALWGGVSAIESHGGDISHDEWKIFARTLRIEDKYPGISGIGVIHYLSDQTMAPYLALRRAERPDFKIHPAHDQAVQMPISFIEPEASNAAAVGLDVAHELNRRTGALASRDTGEARITGPIVLVQDAGSTPGFLFYAPFYRGDAPDEVSKRRENILGAVYAPFVTRKLMEGLLAKDLRNVRFSITDDGQSIYDEHAVDDPLNDPNPLFSEKIDVELYGRIWSVDMKTNLAFRAANTFAQPTIILLAGLLIEILIISLLVMMSRAHGRAVRYAEEATQALRHESAKLAEMNVVLEATNERVKKTNAELEQFAYVISHDLKTPVRGINGLKEMLEEDLEDYFQSPMANTDVRVNLERIGDRVERMNDLIRGVMAISQVGATSEGQKPVFPKASVDALAADFGLSEDQIDVSGVAEAITVDPLNFNRILENLIGNAVKYGGDPEALRISVAVQRQGNRYQVSVRDNGPGIDPQYHDKIFDVFQTLRTPDAPESTGIGLSIVKKAVERHSGKIAVTSQLGEGTEFTFDWPQQPIENAHANIANANTAKAA